MIDRQRLIREAAALGVALGDDGAGRLDRYVERMVETNKHLNLTAITEPREVEIKHLLDSLCAGALDCVRGRVADVGTGCGFPGVALAALGRGLELTLIDATGKKLRFVEDACRETGIEVRTVHGRAEELARGQYRERFDTVVARAVAALPALCELCLPLVRVGGCMVALKGPDGENELEQAKGAIGLLGGGNVRVEKRLLPENGGERTLVVIEKISQTPTAYPRNGKNIAKNPL